MATAILLPDQASQSHQGVGLRLISRVGGAVRSAFARGMGLMSSRRNAAKALPAQVETPAAPVDAPPPEQIRRVRRARSFLPRRRHRDMLFTPEAYPGLDPTVCAFLNTPLEACDPEMVRVLLAAVAEHLAAIASAETGPQDARALFATLCSRVGIGLGEAGPEAPPIEPAAAAAPALPDAPPGLPARLPEADSPSDRPSRNAACPPAPPAEPHVLEADSGNLPDSAVVAAWAILSDLWRSAARSNSGGVSSRRITIRIRTRRVRCLIRRRFDDRRQFSPCDGLSGLLPRHWCYASRASPA